MKLIQLKSVFLILIVSVLASSEQVAAQSTPFGGQSSGLLKQYVPFDGGTRVMSRCSKEAAETQLGLIFEDCWDEEGDVDACVCEDISNEYILACPGDSSSSSEFNCPANSDYCRHLAELAAACNPSK